MRWLIRLFRQLFWRYQGPCYTDRFFDAAIPGLYAHRLGDHASATSVTTSPSQGENDEG